MNPMNPMNPIKPHIQDPETKRVHTEIYKVFGRTIMVNGVQIPDSEAKRLAEANGYNEAKQLVIRFSGQELSVDKQSLRIKGFRRIGASR